jgi:hypothetical protein
MWRRKPNDKLHWPRMELEDVEDYPAFEAAIIADYDAQSASRTVGVAANLVRMDCSAVGGRA